MNNQQEIIFYHYILSNPQLLEKTKAEFFASTQMQEMFIIAKGHIKKYHSPPSHPQLRELVRLSGVGVVTEEIMSAVYEYDMSGLDDEWLLKNASSWVILQNLTMVLKNSITMIKTSDMTAETIPVITEKVRNMIYTETAMDFDFTEGVDLFDIDTHKEVELEKCTTGYPFIDMITKGGFYKKGLHMFLGQPKSGKSWWLYNVASNMLRAGLNVAVVTLEMPESMVIGRVGPNLYDIDIDDYPTMSKNRDFMMSRIRTFKANTLNKGFMYVKEFPTSSLTATQLEVHLKKYQEMKGVTFDFIFLDYVNIMADERKEKGDNLYQKVKNICECLRAIAQKNNWGIVSATQTNKSGWNGTDISADTTSESSGIVQTLDTYFGIIRTDEMKATNTYYLKSLLNRGGGMENYRKKFISNFKFGRITEDTQTSFISDEVNATEVKEAKDNEVGQTIDVNIPKGILGTVDPSTNTPKSEQERFCNAFGEIKH